MAAAGPARTARGVSVGGARQRQRLRLRVFARQGAEAAAEALRLAWADEAAMTRVAFLHL